MLHNPVRVDVAEPAPQLGEAGGAGGAADGASGALGTGLVTHSLIRCAAKDKVRHRCGNSCLLSL